MTSSLYFGLSVYADHIQLHYFPLLGRIIRATLRETFHRWKCDCITNVWDGHPKGPPVILSCKQEEGWLNVSSHKLGGKSLGIILFKSSSRGRGDTETGSNWTRCLPSALMFTAPRTSLGISGIFAAGDLLKQKEHCGGEFCIKIQLLQKYIVWKGFFF